MRLHVMKACAARLRKTVQSADLIERHRISLGRRDGNLATTEALQVRQRHMGADGDAVLDGQRDRAAHDVRIARVKTTGDVRRAHDGKQGGIVAHAPRAEGLAQIAVDVDGLADDGGHADSRRSSMRESRRCRRSWRRASRCSDSSSVVSRKHTASPGRRCARRGRSTAASWPIRG